MGRERTRNVSQGWKPECGFLHYGWEGYNEATILYVLGLGSPTHRLSNESFAGWTSTYQWENLLGQDVLYSGPLFTHLFSHAWIDYRGIRDSFMREKDSDYFENSKRTIAIHREYCARNPRGFEGYDRDLWGITAGDGPGNRELRQSSRDRRFFGYMSRGAPYGPDDGTIAPWAMLATVPFGASCRARWHASSAARLSGGLHSGSVLQRLQSDLGGTRQQLAVRRMVRARSGVAGDDDRKSSQRAHLGNHARRSLRPRGPQARRLRRRLARLMSLDVMQDEFLRRVRPAAWKNPAPKSVYDLAVLGAGPAGLAAAESAAREGYTVALIERYRLGGNSLNAGSIPSKAIIGTSRLFAAMRFGEEYGVPLSGKPPTDFAAVMARMRRIRTRIAEYHSVERCRAEGIDVFFGDARFAGRNSLLAADTRLHFKKAIVATGARPRPRRFRGSIR
jgi:hypothetical protein